VVLTNVDAALGAVALGFLGGDGSGCLSLDMELAGPDASLAMPLDDLRVAVTAGQDSALAAPARDSADSGKSGAVDAVADLGAVADALGCHAIATALGIVGDVDAVHATEAVVTGAALESLGARDITLAVSGVVRWLGLGLLALVADNLLAEWALATTIPELLASDAALAITLRGSTPATGGQTVRAMRAVALTLVFSVLA